MSEDNTPNIAPLALPETPATKVDPRAIEELFRREALTLSDQEIDMMVEFFRDLRRRAMIADREKPKRGTKVSAPKKDGSSVSLEDLGL